jgi:hypothetical protein
MGGSSRFDLTRRGMWFLVLVYYYLSLNSLLILEERIDTTVYIPILHFLLPLMLTQILANYLTNLF